MPAQVPPAPFEYRDSVQQYMVTAKEFLAQNPEYQILCTGAVIYDDSNKMLLVRRAATEKAFPNFWVSRDALPACQLFVATPGSRRRDRKSQAAKWTTRTRRCSTRWQER